MSAPPKGVPSGTFSGVSGTSPADLLCSRCHKSGGFWNACTQPGLKKKCEHIGGLPARRSPVGPPSWSAACPLHKCGIHVHPCGMERADRSFVNAPIGPWPDPVPEPRSDFRLPFFQVRVEPARSQKCLQRRLRVPIRLPVPCASQTETSLSTIGRPSCTRVRHRISP